jgi:hypothetical protein
VPTEEDVVKADDGYKSMSSASTASVVSTTTASTSPEAREAVESDGQSSVQLSVVNERLEKRWKAFLKALKFC